MKKYFLITNMTVLAASSATTPLVNLNQKKVNYKKPIQQSSISKKIFRNKTDDLLEMIREDKLNRDVWEKFGEDDESEYLKYENSQKILNQAIKIIKKNNDENKRFDLKDLNTAHTFGDALRKFKEYFYGYKEFKNIEWISETNTNKKLLDSDFDNGKQYQIIRLKFDSYLSDKFNIYYKNIENIKNILKKIQSKVTNKFNWNNRFDLSDLTINHTFGDALEKIKKYFNNDDYFKNIEWISETNTNKKLLDSNFNNGKQYQIIRLKFDSYLSDQFNIYYKNIGFDFNEKKLNKISKKVQIFNQQNRFDLSGLKLNSNFNDALQRVKKYFEYDCDFKNVQWESQNANNFRLLNHEETQDTIYLKYQNQQSEKITIYYKNSDLKKREELNRAIKKLKVFNKNNRFGLNYLSWDHDYNSAFSKIKKYFYEDKDFKDIEIISITPLKQKLRRRNSYEVTAPISLQVKHKKDKNYKSNNIDVYLEMDEIFQKNYLKRAKKLLNQIIEKGYFESSDFVKNETTFSEAFKIFTKQFKNMLFRDFKFEIISDSKWNNWAIRFANKENISKMKQKIQVTIFDEKFSFEIAYKCKI